MSRLGVRVSTIARALASLAMPRRKAGSPVRRILIAHNLLLGDTILLAPLLKILAARYPDAERVVLARPAVASLFATRPYGFKVLPLDRRDAKSQRAVIDSGPYDLAFVPDDNRYAWLARAAGARRVVGFANDRPPWKNWMLDRAVRYPDRPGAWADIAAMSLCDEGREIEPSPFVVGEWPAPACAEFETPRSLYVVLHVGASTPLKLWPADRWRALADDFARRGLAIVWSGGANERDVLREVTVGDGEFDLVGRLDLAQLWRLLAGAERLVCPDTGIAHLARIVGVPTVTLFGPGSRVIHGAGRFWSQASFAAMTIENFPCRDQHTLYRRELAWVQRCGRRYDPSALPSGRSDPQVCGRALCMQAVGLDEVAEAATSSALTSRRTPSAPS